MFLFWTIAAALIFTFGGVFMKASDGMTRPLPTALMYLSFAAGATFQALALREAELGAAYMLSLGMEVVLVFAFGHLFFGESVSRAKVIGVATIVVGMVLLHRGAPASHPPGGPEAAAPTPEPAGPATRFAAADPPHPQPIRTPAVATAEPRAVRERSPVPSPSRARHSTPAARSAHPTLVLPPG